MDPLDNDVLADAPGPDALPGVKQVVTAMTQLIST